MNRLQEYIPLIILIVVIIIVSFLIVKAYKKVKRVARQMTHTISDVSNIINTVKTVTNATQDVVEVKSIGGATDVYLPRIQQDFPDFHNASAESDIRTFVSEYTLILYGQLESYKKSNILETVDLTPRQVEDRNVTNFTINRIAIYDYKKTKEYATIKYRISLGFDLYSKRVEERYEVSYTYQIADNAIATAVAKCPVCGAPLENLSSGKCPYCGAAFIKDTIMSWSISDIKIV